MIVKNSNGSIRYITFTTSNGKVYFNADQISYVEEGTFGPDITLHMKDGKMIYVKDKLEEVLKEIFPPV